MATARWQPRRRQRTRVQPPRLFVGGRDHLLDDYATDFAQLRGKGRTWLLFSSTWNDDFVRFTLDCLGTRLEEFRATRAVAYLYDFSVLLRAGRLRGRFQRRGCAGGDVRRLICSRRRMALPWRASDAGEGVEQMQEDARRNSGHAREVVERVKEHTRRRLGGAAAPPQQP